jgi:DNA-directed RNA polymerase subunit RPC12/RpoP
MPSSFEVRTRQLTRRAYWLCVTARDLQIAARATRALVGDQVRRSVVRRMARLASGASADPELKETRERRCPHCRSEDIKHAGKVSAIEGLIKSLYRCDRCERLFLILRPAMELGRHFAS